MSATNDTNDIARSLGRLEGRMGGLEEQVSSLSEKVDDINEKLTAERLKLAGFTAVLTAVGFVAMKALELWFGG